ncbi:chaplin [Streptomyces smyrnaeus]|uniref:chaplin n=1 Tax=Streptomyces smyrnaeus TaxID=1387713 RepID=UPI0033B95CAA
MLRYVTTAACAAALVLGGASAAAADAGAQGGAAKSPGALSGNVVQVPVHLPIQVCGNTVDIIALLNPAMGNICVAK